MKWLPLFLVTILAAGCGQKPPPAIDIFTAAFMGSVGLLKQHVDAGTDLELRDTLGGSSPLGITAVFGHVDAARYLIESGANLEAKNSDGVTPLIVAAFFGHTDIVRLLIHSGADLTAINPDGNTALDTVAGEWTQELEQLYLFIGEALKIPLNIEKIKLARPGIADALSAAIEE